MLTIKAPAKINWSLYVLRKREDGYHDILSLIQGIDLYDTIDFETFHDIRIYSNVSIRKENNIVYKAIRALQEYVGIKNGVKVSLKKEIPIGAGLGGGSSDGAFTLKALNELWQLKLSNNELIRIGQTLGSDVSFFFNLPFCLVEGKGDLLKPLKIEKSYILLIVKPKFSISTRWAYESLNLSNPLTENNEKVNNIIYHLYETLLRGDIVNIHLWNDFEKIVMKKYPEIGLIKRQLKKFGAIASVMSGSGSAVFGLFESKESALAAQDHFSGYWSRVVQTLTE